MSILRRAIPWAIFFAFLGTGLGFILMNSFVGVVLYGSPDFPFIRYFICAPCLPLMISYAFGFALLPFTIPSLLIFIAAQFAYYYFIVLGIMAIRSRTVRRLIPGHCRACGSVLSGDTLSRCPECGTTISQ